MHQKYSHYSPNIRIFARILKIRYSQLRIADLKEEHEVPKQRSRNNEEAREAMLWRSNMALTGPCCGETSTMCSPKTPLSHYHGETTKPCFFVGFSCAMHMERTTSTRELHFDKNHRFIQSIEKLQMNKSGSFFCRHTVC